MSTSDKADSFKEFRVGDKSLELGEKKQEWKNYLWVYIRDKIGIKDAAHDFLHISRLLANAKRFSEVVGLDSRERDVLSASILLHDIKVYPKNDPRSKNETTEAAIEAKKLLAETNFPEQWVKDVLISISETSYSRGGDLTMPTAKVLYTLDKLDQTGAIALMRYSASGGQIGRAFYNPQDPLAVLHRRREVFEYTIDALSNRVPKIQRKLYTDVAKQTAKRRNQFLKSSLSIFKAELEEKEKYPDSQWLNVSGITGVVRAFEEAGKTGKLFYKLSDPFGEKRDLHPESYALDQVIQEKNSLLNYLKEVKDETRDSGLLDILNKRISNTNKFLVELNTELLGTDIDLPEIPTIKAEKEFIEQ